MKGVKGKGLNLELVDVDYDFIKEHIDELKKKNKLEKAEILNKILNKLDEIKSKGEEVTNDLLEKVVNEMIDTNKQKIKEEKNKIKKLEYENKVLSIYSQREQVFDVNDLVTIIMS